MIENSKTPQMARFEQMGDARLELATNGLRVRCSTIELVTLVSGVYSNRNQWGNSDRGRRLESDR